MRPSPGRRGSRSQLTRFESAEFLSLFCHAHGANCTHAHGLMVLIRREDEHEPLLEVDRLKQADVDQIRVLVPRPMSRFLNASAVTMLMLRVLNCSSIAPGRAACTGLSETANMPRPVISAWRIRQRMVSSIT